MKKIFLLLSMAILIFTSCEKSELDTTVNQSDVIIEPSPESLYEFSKDIVLISPGGESAVMRVYSDDQSGLENYSSNNFKLIKILDNETLQDALVRNNIMNLNEGVNENELEDEEIKIEEDYKSEYAFKLIDLPSGNFAVSFFHPDSDVTSRSRWRYYTHYSATVQNLEQTVDITRHSFWRRVYYGLRYKVYSTAGWSTVQNEWRKIRNNETVNYTKNPCYQFRARIKTKRGSAYSINFSY